MLSGVGFAMINTQPEEKRGKRLDVLPLPLPPRGLSREQSAAYIDVSASTFDNWWRKTSCRGQKGCEVGQFGTEDDLTNVLMLWTIAEIIRGTNSGRINAPAPEICE
jgi:hypothetical protein